LFLFQLASLGDREKGKSDILETLMYYARIGKEGRGLGNKNYITKM
jgi:hypothetical protein